MVYLTITYGVEEIEKWKNIFEKGSEKRSSGGCKSETVYVSPSDAKKITVLYEWNSKEEFKKFASDPEVQNASKAAGLTSPPEVKFLV